jgi:hypothetical protein
VTPLDCRGLIAQARADLDAFEAPDGDAPAPMPAPRIIRIAARGEHAATLTGGSLETLRDLAADPRSARTFTRALVLNLAIGALRLALAPDAG